MSKLIVIADDHMVAKNYADKSFLSPHDYIVITPNQRDRLMGLELSRDDFVIVGDPIGKWSFWQTLQTRVRS